MKIDTTVARFLEMQRQVPPPIEWDPDRWIEVWRRYMEAEDAMRQLWQELSA